MSDPFNSVEHAVAVGRRTGVIVERGLAGTSFRIAQPGWSVIERRAYEYLMKHGVIAHAQPFDPYVSLRRLR